MLEMDRLIDTKEKDEDIYDRAMRPKSLQDYIGQRAVCEKMEVFIKAAKFRKEALDHTLIFGPPGLGKTTMANIIANEMNANIKITSGPVLEKKGDLVALLTSLDEGDVLFIDEIHRLSPAIEEILYSAMEDYQVDIMIGEGPAANSIKINLKPFTLVGATTKAGSLTSPLRDRFGIIECLEFYSIEDLALIVERSAKCLQLKIDATSAREIAKRARGTPRVANRLIRRIRDFADVKNSSVINLEITDQALQILKIDKQGLDFLDLKLLQTMIEKFSGGPVGLESLSAAISTESETIEDVIEPYLIQQGFIQRTARGRIATKIAYEHLGYTK